MRVLAGYSPGMNDLLDGRSLPNTQHEILCYGTDPNAHLQWDPAVSSYQELAALLPAGWQPDAAVFGSIEYIPVPQGIEYADCLTVGMVGDWNVGAQAYHLMGGAFDLLMADRNGCDRLLQAGFPNVLYTPIWGFDPAVHRLMPDTERDLDIVMVGNLNYNIQRERTPWLARVARLSGKYRVCVTEGVFGDAYARLQNRARIVFNRSIRGELNMRAHEAAACGALMFYERANREIGDLFRDREECVLYDDDDLEALLEYYLTHEEERAAIANAGRLRVQRESDAHHIERLVNLVETQHSAIRARSNRSFLSLPQAERRYCRAYQWCSASNTPILLLAERELLRAQCEPGYPPEISNALGCVAAEIAARAVPGASAASSYQCALRHTRQAVNSRPDYIAAHFNTAFIRLALGDPTAALSLEQTVSLLEAGGTASTQLRGPYFPRRYHHPFVMELEKVWSEHQPESEAWIAEMRNLLLWRCYEQLSDLSLQAGDARRAAELARKSVALRPGIGSTRYRLACALHALEEWREAEAEYRLTLVDAAFSTEVWEQLAELLIHTKQFDSCCVFLDERQTILNGCPHLEFWAATLTELRSRLPVAALPAQTAKTRLIAHLDWSRDEEWQQVLRVWSSQFHAPDPVMLLLTIESSVVQPAVVAMERFAAESLHLTFDEMADTTMIPYDEGALPAALRSARADIWIATDPSVPSNEPASMVPSLPILPLAQLKRDTVLRPHWLHFRS